MNNTPDDWFCYQVKCPDCGQKYHSSEWCECEDEEEEEEEDEE